MEPARDIEMHTLQQMNCYQELSRPKNNQVMHSKYILQGRSDETGAVFKRNALFEVCGTEDLKNSAE